MSFNDNGGGIGSGRSDRGYSRTRSHSSSKSKSSSSRSSSHSNSSSRSESSFGSNTESTGSSFGGFGSNKGGYGNYHSNTRGIGKGTSAHEGFSSAVGGNYSGGNRGNRGSSARDASAISSHTFSQRAADTNYGFNKSSTVGGLTGEGTFADMWSGVKSLFSQNDFATPTDAYKGYGFQAKDYGDTTFNDRSYSEQWSQDKVRTIGNLMKNPMVSTAMWTTGLGAINIGTQLATTAKDMVEGDIDMTKGLGSIASSLVTSTPIGESLGQFKGIVGAGLQDVANIPGAIGRLAGSKLGVGVGTEVAGAINANPYIGAGITALSAIAGAQFGAKGVQTAFDTMSSQPPSSTPLSSKLSTSSSDSRESPLVTSGKLAVGQPQSMMKDPDVTKYARQVNLPFYGNILQPNFNGLPNY